MIYKIARDEEVLQNIGSLKQNVQCHCKNVSNPHSTKYWRQIHRKYVFAAFFSYTETPGYSE